MKTDYTVIGRVRNSENITNLIESIRSRGYSCYDFLHKPAAPEHPELSWNEQMDIMESTEDFWTDDNYKNHFETDLAGLKNAETVVMLLPAGMATHMEAGAAYGFGKKLILIGEVEKPETLYLMFNEHYPTVEAFLETI